MSQIPSPPFSPPPAGSYGSDVPMPRKSNGAAIGSLVCGLLGCVPFVTGLAAIILGIVGLKKTKDPQVGGKGLAIAGLILGILSLLGWTIGIVAGVGGGLAVAKLTEPGRQAAKEWVAAVSAGDIEKAASLSVNAFPREDIVKISGYLQPNGAFQDMTSSNINLANGRLNLKGTATFAKGSRTYDMILVDAGGGKWKMQKVDIE